MIATFITLVTLVLFALFGIAALTFVKSSVTRNELLLAPALGIPILLIPSIWLTRNGFAGHVFALPLVGLLTVASIAIVAVRRPSVEALRGAALPFAAVVFVSAIVVGLPGLHYGLGWLAFDNDDFANYALDATRLIRLDEFAQPHMVDLLASTHPDEWTWFIFAKNGDRFGFDILLAVQSAIAHVDPVRIYMPFMLAMYAVLCLAATALFAKDRSNAVAAAIGSAIALAPANVVSVYYQLGPQIAGLATLACAFYFYLDAFRASVAPSPWRTFLRDGAAPTALAALSFCALLMTYPELVPVFVVSLVLYAGSNLLPIRKANLTRMAQLAIRGALATLAGILIVGFAGINAVILTSAKVAQGTTLQTTGFNSTLTAGGLAALFGFAPIGIFYGSNAFIAISLALAVIVVAWSARTLFKKDPSNIMTLAFFALLADLIHARIGYGAFKTILYMQPFLYGTLADIVFSVRGSLPRRWPQAVAAALCIPMLANLNYYISRSDDAIAYKSAAYTQISSASESGLADDLAKIKAQIGDRTIVSDSNTETLTKIENELLAPNPMRFPSHNPYTTLGTIPFRVRLLPRSSIAARDAMSAQLLADFKATARDDRFLSMNIPEHPVTFTSAKYPPIDGNTLFLYSGQTYTVLNRSSTLPKVRSVGIVPYAQASNALVFVDSSLGVSPNYGLKAALFKPEPDYFVPGRLMAGLGRYLLFEVVNPTPRERFAFWFTRSLDVAGHTALPNSMTIYGKKPIDVRLGGSGSARILSDPIEPYMSGGHAYIAIDLHDEPTSAEVPSKGLAALFNGDLIKPDRKTDGFARDISVVSEAGARAQDVPQSISVFPADLNRCCVQYSGMYEDGWASQDSWFALRSDANSGSVIVDGSIPAGIDTSRARLVLDGRVVRSQTLYPGEFVFTVPLPKGFAPGVHRIELHLSGSRLLGGGDARRASALIGNIGFAAN